MPSVSHIEPVDAPADAVWRLVGDFADDSWTGSPSPARAPAPEGSEDGRSEVRWTVPYETDADPAAVARDLGGLLEASAGALREAAER